jgi:hypothetical protein
MRFLIRRDPLSFPVARKDRGARKDTYDSFPVTTRYVHPYSVSLSDVSKMETEGPAKAALSGDSSFGAVGHRISNGLEQARRLMVFRPYLDPNDSDARYVQCDWKNRISI